MKRMLFASLVMVAMAAMAIDKTLDIRPQAAERDAALTGVEWENTNQVALAAATTDDVLAAFVEDDASARALLGQVKGAYLTDPLVARQIAAVSQWVMTPDPCWLLFWKPSPSDGRKVWVKALLTAAEETGDSYVKTFCLDQLRWCGCDCPCVLGRIRALAASSRDKAVADFAAVVIRELEGKSIGL